MCILESNTKAYGTEEKVDGYLKQTPHYITNLVIYLLPKPAVCIHYRSKPQSLFILFSSQLQMYQGRLPWLVRKLMLLWFPLFDWYWTYFHIGFQLLLCILYPYMKSLMFLESKNIGMIISFFYEAMNPTYLKMSIIFLMRHSILMPLHSLILKSRISDVRNELLWKISLLVNFPIYCYC